MAIIVGCASSLLNAQLVSEVARQRVQDRAADTAANPFLSFLPAGVDADLEGWRGFVGDLAQMRSADPTRGSLSLLAYDEVEAVGQSGLNDFDALAEWLPSRDGAAGWRINGRLDGTPTDFAVVADVGGSIPEGTDLSGVLADGARQAIETTIGDGAHGSSGSGTGDFDAYCFDGLAGETLVAAVATPPMGALGAGLDPFLALVDAGGELVAFEDEIIEGGFFVSTDARMEQRLPLDDRYCLFVGGSDFDGSILPEDWTDAGSGSGVVSEGDYRLEVAIDPPDRFGRDLFAFSVEAGDVVGATLRDGAGHRLGLLDAEGQELVATRFDLSGLYPASSPLPAGGAATVAYVMPRAQTVLLSVEAGAAFTTGDYGVELAVLRPVPFVSRAGESQRGADIQRVVLEFDGGLVDRSRFFGGVLDPEVVALSGLSSFLERWGLVPSDLNQLIAGILTVTRHELDVRVAQQGVNGDWRQSGTRGEFAVEVAGGTGIVAGPGDVRVVIGGTTDELRLRTIGIAEAIDPGNFEKTKVAVVLLDLLSGPAGDDDSLNGVALAPVTSKIDLIATALGRIAAHEAGHLFGNFHTERDVGPATIMDSGGRLDLLLGLGHDGVFGSGDDSEVHLDHDEYSRREPFDGVEPTLNVLSHGLPVGRGERVRVEPARIDFGSAASGTLSVQEIELTNEGTVAQPIRLGPSDGGCGTCAFTVSENTFTLAPGERRRIGVRFFAFAALPFRTELTVEASAGAATIPFVELTGVGGTAGLEGLPAQPVFPSILYPGGGSTSTEIRLRNTGDVAVRPTLRLQGPHANRFVLVAPSRGFEQDLPPGEVVVVDITFDPEGAVGEAKASLWLFDALRAVAPSEILLRARSDGPVVSLEPRPYVFGALRADGASGRRSFRIENRGTRALRLDRVLLGDATPDEFLLTAPSTPRDIAPGETVLAPVVFAPSDALLYRGELVVETDDPEEPRAVADMLGLGLLPMIEVWPTVVRLDAVPPGETVDGIVVRVANVGGATLNGSIDLEDPSGAWTLIPPPGSLRVVPESETELLLSYSAPRASVARGTDGLAELVIRSDDRESSEVRIPLLVGSVLDVPSGGALASVLLATLLAFLTFRRIR